VTQQEAARELGISTEAVRMRVRRGSLESSKDDQGRVVVWAVSDRTQSSQETARQPDELVEALEDRIESLERSLEHERESSRRKDSIIMQMAQRMPELEASEDATPEPAEGSGGVTEEGSAGEPSARARRPWWRRWLGR
jgi:predicted ArsR family transcriptional regulator